MKRFALALVAAVALSLFAAPAHADKPECYTVAELPGECLTLTTYNYLNRLTDAYVHGASELSRVSELYYERADEVTALRAEVWQGTVALYDMTQQRDNARLVIARRDARIRALRAKVRDLRLIIRG